MHFARSLLDVAVLFAFSPLSDWPIGGEIDIMEGKGRLPSWMSGSLHRSLTRGAVGDVVSAQSYQLASGNFHDAWHVFSVEWDEQQIRWYVDSSLFQTVSRPTAAAEPWPFDQPFYFLLNLAVGGVFDAGVLPPAGMAPQRLYVDYVRVFRKIAASVTVVSAQPQSSRCSVFAWAGGAWL